MAGRVWIAAAAAVALAGCEKPTDPVKLCNYWPGERKYTGATFTVVDEHGGEYIAMTSGGGRSLTPTGVNYGPRKCRTVTRAEWKAREAGAAQ